jgi:ribosomal-protein-alanine N-acetyltransferase
MYKIRKSTAQDISAIDSVNKECLVENYDIDTYVMHIKLYNMTYVATLDDKIVGYVMGRIEDGVEVHVTSIAVLPTDRGNKLGLRLMTSLLVDAKKRGIKSCSLQVRVGNIVARHIYKRLGFQELRELPAYYADGEDGILMRRIPL